MSASRFRSGRRRLLLAAGGALSAGCAAPRFAAPPPGPVAAPRIRVGQQWRYEEINRYNGLRRAIVTAQVIEAGSRVRVAVSDDSGKQRDDEIYVGAWQVVQEPAYDLTQHFDQPLPLLPEPLAAGGGGYSNVVYRSALNRDVRLPWVQKLTAQGWERIRVPAGEFLALRVERIVQYTHIDFTREGDVRYDTVWYAPEVERWVQREWTGTYIVPGGDFQQLFREDWVRWQLLDWQPGA